MEADLLSDEEFLRIGRETKSIQAVVTRLLELGRADEAIQDASQANGWQMEVTTKANELIETVLKPKYLQPPP